MKFSLLPCYIVPSRPKYSPQNPILKHPQPMFLPQRERHSFTLIQNNKQNYSSVCLNPYIFRQQTGRQKILHLMTASIPLLQFALNFFLNRILICLGCSQISELFHPFKRTIINLCTVTSSCILSQDMTMYLVLSAFTSSPISLLATTKAYMFFFIV